MIYKKLFLIAFIALLFFASNSEAQSTQNNDIPTLTYSELMANKDFYLGKTVRVKAIWIYGFEWSFLCDSDCSSRKSQTWIEFVDEDDLCKGSKKKLKKGSDNFDNKAEIIFVGTLANGNFGHFGAYPYQLKVGCVEQLKKLKVEIK
jgi:hypothetical protein